MLIVGMFFFWVAVMSGLFGFADIYSADLPAAHYVFYASLLLATLIFTLRLLRTGNIQDAVVEEPATEPVAFSVETTPSESAPLVEAPAQSAGRALVMSGPLVAGMR